MDCKENKPPENSPAVALLQMIDGFFVSQALHVVAKLGLADQLAKGPKNVDVLASSAGVDSGMLYRLLRALASVNVFTEVEPRSFALTPMGAYLRTDAPGSTRRRWR